MPLKPRQRIDKMKKYADAAEGAWCYKREDVPNYKDDLPQGKVVCTRGKQKKKSKKSKKSQE